MRVDRVMDLLELLRARDAVTVAELAAELGVSKRTVLRDLRTLRARGQPIRSDPGPGGGVSLDRDRGLASVQVPVEALASLWLSVRVSGAAGALPFSAAARSALDRLFAALPDDRARSLRQLVRRIRVGRPASARIREELGAPEPELLPAFERAFTSHLCLGFDYLDRRGRASRRVVEPHGLLTEPPALYVLARDTSHGEARLFRLDRIHRPRVITSRPFTPAFDALWAEVNAGWERDRAPLR